MQTIVDKSGCEIWVSGEESHGVEGIYQLFEEAEVEDILAQSHGSR
jgi:hypothetical protein